jgi:hypothetical protein
MFPVNNARHAIKMKQDNCNHKDKKIETIKVTATCETTVLVCTECNKYLSEPKIEC